MAACAAVILPGARAATLQLDAPVQEAELTPDAEAAIEKALLYLSRTQAEDGGWLDSHRVSSAALALMAFMVKGDFPGREPYGAVLDKAVDFLIRESVRSGGYMGDSMYEHALATLALSEAWGMSDREGIRDVLKRAVDVILRAQDRCGGWRYQPRPCGADISVTVMQVVALASAKEAGIFVPDKTIDDAIAYVKALQEKASGGFGYAGASQPSLARTAAGVTALMMCGQRDSAEVRRGLEYLLGLDAGTFTNAEFYHYGHYYAIQAMYQAGESYYQNWYPKIREALVKSQRPDGAWGHDYTTPMSVLILGVPYRYLPIYQR